MFHSPRSEYTFIVLSFYFLEVIILLVNFDILWSHLSYAYQLDNCTVISIQLLVVFLFVLYHLCYSFLHLNNLSFTICPCPVLTLHFTCFILTILGNYFFRINESKNSYCYKCYQLNV
jgi:hypothetical protein